MSGEGILLVLFEIHYLMDSNTSSFPSYGKLHRDTKAGERWRRRRRKRVAAACVSGDGVSLEYKTSLPLDNNALTRLLSHILLLPSLPLFSLALFPFPGHSFPSFPLPSRLLPRPPKSLLSSLVLNFHGANSSGE